MVTPTPLSEYRPTTLDLGFGHRRQKVLMIRLNELWRSHIDLALLSIK